jgi:hypothetical protein
MKTSGLVLVMSTTIILALLVACGKATPPATGPSDAEVAATVNAAVAATNAAEAAMQATIDAAVAATAAAQPTPPPTLVVVPTSTPPPQPAAQAPTAIPPTPVVVDTSSMSEEELAAAIDAAVAAAVAATQDAAAATTNVASDGTVTYDETVTVEVTLTNAEEALAMAEALVAAYNQTYGAYAAEALDTLNGIESDLEAMADSTEAIYAIMEQGSETASAAIDQIQSAAATASAHATQIQAQTQQWREAAQAEREGRAAQILATQPSQIAGDRQGAMQSAMEYVDSVRGGLADGVISGGELSDIAQKGANASASIKAHGGPQLKQVGDSIDSMTGKIARGDLPQVQKELPTLESSLRRR